MGALPAHQAFGMEGLKAHGKGRQAMRRGREGLDSINFLAFHRLIPISGKWT
jgi:hypothetical protein